MSKKANFLLTLSLMTLFTSIICLHDSTFLSIEIPFMSLFFSQLYISIILDWMSLLFMSTVMFISSMIILFSFFYIPEPEHKLFTPLLLMFILSMVILIISDNLIFILLGWDGLGLSSYILVVYYQNHSSAASGSITIISNRIGDIMILISIATLFMNLNWNFSMNETFPMYSLLFIMIAAMSKSAQFPFSAWLPAAMSAPTPISALVHSSTLVTAGIYIMIRITNFNHPNCLFSLMIISSMTALYASMSALWENDMKKIIALSTLSQMAMMMFAISLNAISIAFFHLITHALFKSMMFLCAGNMIHNSSYQDMRHMGSIFLSLPITSSILGLSSMALMGIPFLSGFFSKDAIIESLIASKLYHLTSLLMIFSISLTSMYSIRMTLFSLKFIMNSKPDMNFHSSIFMELPLLMMALFSVFSGSLILWVSNPFQCFIFPFNLKISIIISLILGIFMSISIKFKSNMFLLLGESAISLWFLHFISSFISIISNPLMKKFSENDKSWQEKYGPSNIYFTLKWNSKLPFLLSSSLLPILMLISFFPIILFL